MKESKIYNTNTIYFGLILGAVAPWVILLLYYFVEFHYMRLNHFFYRMVAFKLLTPVISLCVLVNLLLFYLFYWKKKDKSSRGVVLVTLIYAAIIFAVKMI